MLRIFGDFDPEPLLLRLGWDGKWWRKGELNRRGAPFDQSGIQLRVSDAGFDDFAAQIADAVEFLTEASPELAMAMGEAGVTQGVLDFGVAQYDYPAYWRRFPAQLVALAGRAGLGLELSLYAVSGVGNIPEQPLQ